MWSLFSPAARDLFRNASLLVFEGLILCCTILAAEKNDRVQILWGESTFSIEEYLKPHGRVTFSFPQAMVSEEAIHAHADADSPLRWSPELLGKWIWKSPSEGVFEIGERVQPGIRYEVSLKRGLRTFSGAAADSLMPAETRASAPFEVTLDMGEKLLGKRPQVSLAFSYPVDPAQVAAVLYFQDRDSRKRYPAEVEVALGETKTRRLRALPREELPHGCTFDLVVENVKEAHTGALLMGPKVLPLGTTVPLRVVKISTSHTPLEQPRIEVEFNEPVGASEGSKINLEPPVAGLRFSASEKNLVLEGPFLSGVRYRVEVPSTVVGARGYSLERPSIWGAQVSRKPASVLFPGIGQAFATGFMHRSVARRAKTGFQFPFVQVNTGELRWRLAAVPPEKLPAILRRLWEHHHVVVDPVSGKPVVRADTGTFVKRSTDLLIESSRLHTLAEGTFPASFEDTPVSRELVWAPQGPPPLGPCLLEISGKDADGVHIGNRALIHFTEVAILQKNEQDEHVLRIVTLEDGTPLASVPVRLVSKNNHWLAESTTDANGMARFPKDLFFRDPQQSFAAYFLVDTSHGTVCEPVQRFGIFGGYFWSRHEGAEEGSSGEIHRVRLVPDRPLYRPAQSMRFKGFARRQEGGGGLLKPVEGRAVEWKVVSVREAQTEVHSGRSQTDAFGGFEGLWEIPANTPVGPYEIQALLPGITTNPATESIRVEEFRAPPFSVDLTGAEKPGSLAGLDVQSRLFHGAPNAQAEVRWKATWREVERQSEGEIFGDLELQTAGTGQLDAGGTLHLEVSSPFKDQRLRGRFRVFWEVDVVGLDGQTIHETTVTRVCPVPVILSTVASHKNAKSISVEVHAWNAQNLSAPGVPVEVNVVRELEKIVREQIAEHVFRVHKTIVSQKVATLSGVTPFSQNLPVDAPGSYKLIASASENPAVPEVSDTTTVQGELTDPVSEFSEPNERFLEFSANKTVYEVGDTAELTIRAPFAGKAWVSLESNRRVLDQFEAEIVHNAGLIRVPVKEAYFPNVYVTVHLLHPGGVAGLPKERAGRVELKVRDPNAELQVATGIATRSVEPGNRVTGTLRVSRVGVPVSGADITLYAVDEALLVAGDWRVPQLSASLYPPRFPGVNVALPELWRLAFSLNTRGEMQKGFIVGGGGDDDAFSSGRKNPRKNFLPIATWQTGLRSDGQGQVDFSFVAPDSLTTYRVVALAQTRDGAFGVHTDTIEVSKKIQIEPALPRFLRTGDRVELRALLRQKIADLLTVPLHAGGSLHLTGGTVQTQQVPKDQPAVYRFEAQTGETSPAKVEFWTNAGAGDSVEIQMPVHPPTLLRKEAVAGVVGEGSLEEAARALPERWDGAVGEASFTLSASPWFPKLAGLPRVLEYPHGCSEQIATRILSYTVLGDLIQFLPEDDQRDRFYRERVSKGLERFAATLLPDGSLPYWPGLGASPFSTVIGCWAVQSAASLGWPIPGALQTQLPGRVLKMALGKDPSASEFTRCFALLVSSLSVEHRDVLEPVARDLYARRARFSEEMRAFLAVAMHRLGILEEQREQLLREIDHPLTVSFDPRSFASLGRTEGVRAWAFATLHPGESDGKTRLQLQHRISQMLEDSPSLSTQENFWLLLAFRELHAAVLKSRQSLPSFAPKPDQVSRNGLSARWNALRMSEVRRFSPGPDAGSLLGLSVMWEAQFRMAQKEHETALNRGLRVERVVKNRTHTGRTGSKEHPFKLGDELEITFRLISPRDHHYVALEAELPACFESVRHKKSHVADAADARVGEEGRELEVSFFEARDKSVCLFFDRVMPGLGVASTVVRVTSVGTFTWPPTQVAPMYDSRFSAVSAGSLCEVTD